MLIEQVDVVRPQPPQTALDRTADLRRSAVDAAQMVAGGLIDIPAELGRDLDGAATGAKCLAQHLLVGPRAVDLCRVKEIHAAIHSRADQGDHLGPVRNLAVLAITHESQRQG